MEDEDEKLAKTAVKVVMALVGTQGPAAIPALLATAVMLAVKLGETDNVKAALARLIDVADEMDREFKASAS